MAMRTHVILRDDQRVFLLNESARTGLPIAELVRRALDTTYRIRPHAEIAGFELTVGLWRRLDAAVTGRRLRQVDGEPRYAVRATGPPDDR
jgi:hypothetical protein